MDFNSLLVLKVANLTKSCFDETNFSAANYLFLLTDYKELVKATFLFSGSSRGRVGCVVEHLLAVRCTDY